MKYKSLFFLLLISFSINAQQTAKFLQWPGVSSETRPWTRWWWPGSIGTREDMTAALEEYRSAGLGGLELTVLYGVRDQEDRFVDYLSPDWINMFSHILNESKRLNLGIDLANASSWPFGGPWVTPDDASKYVAYKTYSIAAGQKLAEIPSYNQEPLIRWSGTFRADISSLAYPVYKNTNLQELSIDQVRFPGPLPIHTIMAYSDEGNVINLFSEAENGKLSGWTAPEGKWTVYAVFQGWHGKMVERAGPGGEGYVIDHFSQRAVKNFLAHFDTAFKNLDKSHLRGYFNDSYEVDDAKGQSDWTPLIFKEFSDRRGYDLRNHLPALFQKDNPEKNARVLSDYRQTISDLILDNFTKVWTSWAGSQGKITRNQSHGSPANILDLYAASDIPETEGTEILRMKFATSAANVSGKRLVSAEAATWLGEHFSSTLLDVKKTADQYFISGVNHIFYHGTCFSPKDEPWPGFQFYAAVEFSPANTIWSDFPALNSYITRVQSFLQNSRPDNDILLYFPVFDRYADFRNSMVEHFDGIGAGFNGSHFKSAAETMQNRGYSFDFISDNQITALKTEDGLMFTGGVGYKTLVLPQCRYIPVGTFNRIVNLAEKGATVIFFGKMPEDVSGWYDLDNNREIYGYLKEQLAFKETATAGISEALVGNGRILSGENLGELLDYAGIRRETMTDNNLGFSRKKLSDGICYFIVNQSGKPFSGWVNLSTASRSAAIFDPITGGKGLGKIQAGNGKTAVFLRLAPFQSAIVKTSDRINKGEPFRYYDPTGNSSAISGSWNLIFINGGPALPAEKTIAGPLLWEGLEGAGYRDFSGTAEYSVSFPKPAEAADAWLLDLGRAYESARIYLNDKELQVLLGPDFQVVINKRLLKPVNSLRIQVTSLAANRIAYLDRVGVYWKKFYNVNFPSRLPQNRKNGIFDASGWKPFKSGLEGPVTLTPLRMAKIKSESR